MIWIVFMSEDILLNYIKLNNEIYRLDDAQHDDGLLIYSHTGQDSVKRIYIKEISITISTKAWVLTKFQPQSVLTFDTTPTMNSTNPVTSDGIYNAISSRGATELWTGNITSNTNNLSVDTMSDYNFIMIVGKSEGGTTASAILPMPYFIVQNQLHLNLNTPNKTRGIGVTYVSDTQVDVSVTSATLLAIYGIN